MCVLVKIKHELEHFHRKSEQRLSKASKWQTYLHKNRKKKNP